VIDPGIGFGKTTEHNLALLRAVRQLSQLGYPLLIGASRKRFLGTLLQPVRGEVPPVQRDIATMGVIALSMAAGARIVRVHDVPSAVEVAVVVDAIVRHDGRDELI